MYAATAPPLARLLKLYIHFHSFIPYMFIPCSLCAMHCAGHLIVSVNKIGRKP